MLEWSVMPTTVPAMRLGQFIVEQQHLILRSLASKGEGDGRLRTEHMALLADLAGSLHTPPKDAGDAAAALGEACLKAALSTTDVLAEYTSLRRAVTTCWQRADSVDQIDALSQVLDFDRVLDAALGTSLARYAALALQAQHLFLAILGHDLRNPLNTTVVASSYLMRLPQLSPGDAQVVARIHRSGLRMGGLINDLIDYSRTHLDSALPLAPTKANMGSICRGVVDELRVTNPDRMIYYDAGSDLDGIWDEGRIAQVFSNLLGNAVQHGRASKPITMHVDSSGSHVSIRIHNEGQAIAAELLPTIFDPLVRLAASRAPQQASDNSLGLGLYIARAVVVAHGGDIDVSSSDAQGTTFSVRIPRLPPPGRAQRSG
ncbi:MAG: sensor histidine kinase [Massilia sp.]